MTSNSKLGIGNHLPRESFSNDMASVFYQSSNKHNGSSPSHEGSSTPQRTVGSEKSSHYPSSHHRRGDTHKTCTTTGSDEMRGKRSSLTNKDNKMNHYNDTVRTRKSYNDTDSNHQHSSTTLKSQRDGYEEYHQTDGGRSHDKTVSSYRKDERVLESKDKIYNYEQRPVSQLNNKVKRSQVNDAIEDTSFKDRIERNSEVRSRGDSSRGRESNRGNFKKTSDKSETNAHARSKDNDTYSSGNRHRSRREHRPDDSDNQTDKRYLNDNRSRDRGYSRGEYGRNGYERSSHVDEDAGHEHGHRNSRNISYRKDNSVKDSPSQKTSRRRSSSVTRDDERNGSLPDDAQHHLSHINYTKNCALISAADHRPVYSTTRRRFHDGHDTERCESFHQNDKINNEIDVEAPYQRSSKEHRYNATVSLIEKSSAMFEDANNSTNTIGPSPTHTSNPDKQVPNSYSHELSSRHCRSSREDTRRLESPEMLPSKRKSSCTDKSDYRSNQKNSNDVNHSNFSSASRRRSVSSKDEQSESHQQHFTNRRYTSSSKSLIDDGFVSSQRDDYRVRSMSEACYPRDNDEGHQSQKNKSRPRGRSNVNNEHHSEGKDLSQFPRETGSSNHTHSSNFSSPATKNETVPEKNTQTFESQNKEQLQCEEINEVVHVKCDLQKGIEMCVSEAVTLPETVVTENRAPPKSRSTNNSSVNITKENESQKVLPKDNLTELFTFSKSELKDNNSASKTFLSDSFSSFFGRGNRDQQPQANTSSQSTSIFSITEKLKWLKQGIISDKDVSNTDTHTGVDTAAAIFQAAATKIVNSLNSLPGVQIPLPKETSFASKSLAKCGSSGVSISNPNTSKEKSEASIAKTTDTSKASLKEDLHDSAKRNSLEMKKETKSDNQSDTVPGISRSKTGQSSQNGSALNKSCEVRPECQTDELSCEQVSSDPRRSVHSNTSFSPPSDSVSQRMSTVSAGDNASTLHRRTSIYAKKNRRADSPESDETGQSTPTSVSPNMKRRSKEMDNELTSFLPAEMSRKEEKFHEAAKANCAAAIRRLVKEKVNVDCRNSLDRTALHWAAANGNLEATEALIECGADVEAKDKYGMRAVLWAAWFGHITVLKALVNAGANTRVINKQGLGVLHCAAEKNHLSVISFVFDALEPHHVNQRDKNERTPLHLAAESGHVDAVNRLLEAKADLHKKDKGGMTAVHVAAKLGHIEVLKALLLQGVEVDDRDVDGKTALHLAAETGHKEVVDLLLDYTANPNSDTVKEITPLHVAAQEGHVDVCKSLVKYGSNVNAQNFQGNSALHIAANSNHKEVARILIDVKSELDLPNNRLQTPLHVAIESGHFEVVQVLLAGGASLHTREKSGKSALQLAARGNYVTAVDMIIKAERYYAYNREYHDKDVGYVDPDTYLRNPQHPKAPQMKDIMWKLAMKQLKPADWKKLAYHWHFTSEHVKAIEQEYTGTTSYKEHGYRLLDIWLHGVRKDENVVKLLTEALVAIDRKQLAESVRWQVCLQAEKPCSPPFCTVS